MRHCYYKKFSFQQMEWVKPQVMGNILINVGTDGIIMTFLSCIHDFRLCRAHIAYWVCPCNMSILWEHVTAVAVMRMVRIACM